MWLLWIFFIIKSFQSLITNDYSSAFERLFRYSNVVDVWPGGFGYSIKIFSNIIIVSAPTNDGLFSCRLDTKSCTKFFPFQKAIPKASKNYLGCGGSIAASPYYLFIGCQYFIPNINDNYQEGNFKYYFPKEILYGLYNHDLIYKNSTLFMANILINSVTVDIYGDKFQYKSYIETKCNYRAMTVCSNIKDYIILSCDEKNFTKNSIIKIQVDNFKVITFKMSDILMFDLFGNHLECDAVIEKEKQQLIISSPGYSSIALNAGMVQICQMDIDPVDSEETLNCFIIYGDNSTNEMFGYTVKAVDDLNYDGVKDLIVAAPFKNNNKGCIYLFTGLNPKIFNTYKMILSNTEDILNYGITIEYGPMIDLNGKINTLIIGSTGSITVYKVNPFIEIIMDFTIPTVLNRMTMPSNMSFPISYTMAPLTLIKIEQSLIFMCSNQLNITNQTCPYSIIITNNQNTGTLMGFMNYEIGLFESKTIDLSMTFSGKFNETLPLVQKTITKNIIYNGRCVNPDKPNNAKLISVDALLNKNTNENNLLLLFESDVNICSMELEMTFNSTIEKIVFGTLDEYIYEKQLIQNGIFYIKVSPVVNLSKKILLTIEILTNEKSQFIQATIKTLIVNAVLIIQNDMPIQWIIDEEAILIAEGSLSSSNMNIPFIIKTSTLIYYFIRLSNLMLISMKDVEIYLKINVNNAAIWDGNFIISGDDQASSSVNCILDNANKEMSDLFGYYERIIKCSTSLSLLNFTSFHLSFNLSISENLENVIFKVDMFTKSKAINNIVYNNYTYDVKSCNINTYTAEVKYEQRLQDWVIMIICIVIPPLICLIIGIIVIKLKILTKSFK